jgi:transposase
MEDNGDVKEQYEFLNDESSWAEFRERYLSMEPEISLEVSTSGKHVARKLREMGFSVHLADPSKLSLIFNTARKNVGEVPGHNIHWKELRKVLCYQQD